MKTIEYKVGVYQSILRISLRHYLLNCNARSRTEHVVFVERVIKYEESVGNIVVIVSYLLTEDIKFLPVLHNYDRKLLDCKLLTPEPIGFTKLERLILQELELKNKLMQELRNQSYE